MFVSLCCSSSVGSFVFPLTIYQGAVQSQPSNLIYSNVDALTTDRRADQFSYPRNANLFEEMRYHPNPMQGYHPSPTGSVSPTMGPLEQIRVQLENKVLWDQFHGSGTEMIITKAGKLARARCRRSPHLRPSPLTPLSM